MREGPEERGWNSGGQGGNWGFQAQGFLEFWGRAVEIGDFSSRDARKIEDSNSRHCKEIEDSNSWDPREAVDSTPRIPTPEFPGFPAFLPFWDQPGCSQSQQLPRPE